MNLAQRVILIIAFMGVSAMAIFPPWIFVYDAPRQKRVERPAGYHLIFGDHTPQDIEQLASLFGFTGVEDFDEFDAQLRYFAVRLDGTRLFAQVSLALALTLILFFILKTKS